MLSAVSRCCADELIKGEGGGTSVWRQERFFFFFCSRTPPAGTDDCPSGEKPDGSLAPRRGFCFPPVPSSRVPPGRAFERDEPGGAGPLRARRALETAGDGRGARVPRGGIPGRARDREGRVAIDGRVRRGCARAMRRHATHHHETAGEALLRGERGDRGRRAARRARGGGAEGGRQSAEHREGDAGGRERARRGMGASTTRGAVCANSLLQHRSRK